MPKQDAGPGASREWRRTPYRQSGAAKKEAPEGTARRDGKDGPQIVRSGGKRWTDAAEAKFLDLLAATNNVTLSAAETGFSKEAIYRRRRNDPGFASRWQAALDQGYARVEMLVVQVAADTLEGRAPDPDCPIPPMTVREAITVLQLHRASVKGDGTTRRAGWQGRVRSLDEVRESILRKLAAFDRHDPPRNGEGDHAQHGGGAGGQD